MHCVITKFVFSFLSFILLSVTLPAADKTKATMVERPNTQAVNASYRQNRAPLQPQHFIKLPVGRVKPQGWLQKHLELQKEGLNGHLSEISAWLDKENNAWLGTGNDYGWEEVPYWLKGYGNMAYILEDKEMIREAQSWIEAVFKSRREDGYFGPYIEKNGKPDLWGNMIMIWCLQSYYEHSGDKRVIDLMTGYFQWQLRLPDDKFLEDYWENSRGGATPGFFMGYGCRNLTIRGIHFTGSRAYGNPQHSGIFAAPGYPEVNTDPPELHPAAVLTVEDCKFVQCTDGILTNGNSKFVVNVRQLTFKLSSRRIGQSNHARPRTYSAPSQSSLMKKQNYLSTGTAPGHRTGARKRPKQPELLGPSHLAEGVGFEPTDGRPSTVFKTVALSRSATPPTWRGY